MVGNPTAVGGDAVSAGAKAFPKRTIAIIVACFVVFGVLILFLTPRIASGTLFCVPASSVSDIDGVYAHTREKTDVSGETSKWLDVITIDGRYASAKTYNKLGTDFVLARGTLEVGSSKVYWSNNTTSSVVFSAGADKVVVTGDVSGVSESYFKIGTPLAASVEDEWKTAVE